ncbi:hypothetical protein [Microbacterium sp. CJ88]|uniref:hypothetical protein n=1 Tax=Microbacterium sp. CJ88 TaxID=3445672 RepID=UPI003F65EF45
MRFPDPLERRDAAGRIIPHDFVVMGSTVSFIGSVEDGLREIWPAVADVYGQVWDSSTPPSMAKIRSQIEWTA